MVYKFHGSQFNHPYFHKRESKVPYKRAAPPVFSFEVFLDGFFGTIFSSVVQIFCLTLAFRCKFSTGLVCLAETCDILYSLANGLNSLV